MHGNIFKIKNIAVFKFQYDNTLRDSGGLVGVAHNNLNSNMIIL